MEMKINSKLIVKLRKEKGWSQQHLSLVSGVSLRTVQRVENEGNTSVETIKSLASAFETDFNNLILKVPQPNRLFKKAKLSFAALVSLAISVVLTSTTTASPGIDIQAERVIVSHDERETTFVGKVTLVIPGAVPFEISTIDSNSNEVLLPYKLKITTEQSSFLVLDARITRIDDGLVVKAEQMTTSRVTDQGQ